MLLQMRIGIVFPLFLAMGLRARRDDAGFHKRMMIRGTAVALPAAIDRMQWFPTTPLASALASDYEEMNRAGKDSPKCSRRKRSSSSGLGPKPSLSAVCGG